MSFPPPTQLTFWVAFGKSFFWVYLLEVVVPDHHHDSICLKEALSTGPGTLGHSFILQAFSECWLPHIHSELVASHVRAGHSNDASVVFRERSWGSEPVDIWGKMTLGGDPRTGITMTHREGRSSFWEDGSGGIQQSSRSCGPSNSWVSKLFCTLSGCHSRTSQLFVSGMVVYLGGASKYLFWGKNANYSFIRGSFLIKNVNFTEVIQCFAPRGSPRRRWFPSHSFWRLPFSALLYFSGFLLFCL